MKGNKYIKHGKFTGEKSLLSKGMFNDRCQISAPIPSLKKIKKIG